MGSPDRRSIRHHRLVRGRARTRPPVDAGAASPLETWALDQELTPSELVVVRQCVRGLSNKEIAALLAKSPATVRAQLLSVFRKLGITSRGELAHAVFTVMEGHATKLAEERRVLFEELEEKGRILERERALLDAVLRQSPLGLLVADPVSRRVVLANDEAVRMLGGPPRNVGEWCATLRAARPDGAPIRPQDSPLARVLAGAERVQDELTGTRPDGTKVVLEVHATLVRDRAGAPLAALGILVDATARHAAQADLVRAERTAREALAAREKFVRIVAKDLNAPAENVVNLARLISTTLETPVPDARQRAARMARHLEVSSRSLWRYLHDLVELGELDGARSVARPATLSPAALLETAVETALARPKETQTTIESVETGGLPLVLADPNLLQRVFMTLIDRAVGASPPGAKVVVEAAPDPTGVRFSVRDTGPPLPHEHEKNIFDRNWLLTVGARRGLGIGLLVAKEIVERHLGRLWADSGPGGVAFHFTLPTA